MIKPLYTQEEFDKAKYKDFLPLECNYCYKRFLVKKVKLKNKKKIQKNFMSYCCRKCKSDSEIIILKRDCANCGKHFEYRSAGRTSKSKSGKRFCSQRCSTIYWNCHREFPKRSRLELWIQEKLTIIYPDLEIHYNKRDAIDAELDIYIPSIKLAIELNGAWHFEPIFGEDKLKSRQNNDERKLQACFERGIDPCVIDTRELKYNIDKNCIPYLDFIKNIIDEKIKLLTKI